VHATGAAVQLVSGGANDDGSGTGPILWPVLGLSDSSQMTKWVKSLYSSGYLQVGGGRNIWKSKLGNDCCVSTIKQ